MLTKYRSAIDRFHNYLCSNPQHPILEIHNSHVDQNKLFKARVIAWTYITVIYIWVLWEMASITTNFIYLTLQGYFITWLFYTMVLQDYWLTKIYGKQNHPCKKLKHYAQIIYETALCFQFPITLVFWGFLFQILLRQHASVAEIIMNTNLHLGPLVCLLVELYYNNFSFPKRHLWVLIIYGIFYLLINLVYSLGVKVIYQPIDWKSFLSYALVVGCIIFVCGAHRFGGYSYRRWKARKLTTRIMEGLIQQVQPRQSGDTTSPSQSGSSKNNFKNPYGPTNNFQISDRINQGLKKEVPLKDGGILL